MIPTVYLAGPINGCTDEQATGWRDRARRVLQASGYMVFDPMARDYRGRENENAAAIVEGDLSDIRACSHMLVNVERPSWGTAMEIALASRVHGKRVVGFGAGDRPSPWLLYHVTLRPTLSLALQELGCPVLTCARLL